MVAVENPISHPRFASFYNWLVERPRIRRRLEPWRREIIGHAHGVVLEVGAGAGQTFPFYDTSTISRVEATDPDETMLTAARSRLASAVAIVVTQAVVEALPFADASFDSVVASLVFCSVEAPDEALREIRRVLRGGGDLLMIEHVRSGHRATAWLQDAIAPITTRLGGNCHWNRDTARTVVAAGFEIVAAHRVRAGLQPVVLVHARRPLVATE